VQEKSATDEFFCTDYTPFGAVAKVWNNPDQTQRETYRHGYQGQYAEQDTTTGWNAFQLRMYDPLIGRWLSTDPERQFSSPYNGMGNNPISGIDPTGGKMFDWFDIDGEIVWIDVTGDFTEYDGTFRQSLGTDLIVATHARDALGNEAINGAGLALFKGSVSTAGPISSINGNTVPAIFDGSNFSTLAEGLYAADFAPRTSYPNEMAVFIQRLDRQSIVLPTTTGGTMQEIFLHKGNWNAETLISNQGEGPQYSQGCQTTGCGPGAQTSHTVFMNAVGRNFHGTYYLRSNPN